MNVPMTAKDCVKLLIAAAERQEAFAGPAYPHLTDAEREKFKHAAKQLRESAAEIARRIGITLTAPISGDLT